METTTPAVAPRNLSVDELVRYARLYNNTGLPKDWCDALINALEDALYTLSDDNR